MAVIYSAIRFVPDIVSGEFINVGVIAYNSNVNRIEFSWEKGITQRMEGFFGEAACEIYTRAYDNLIGELERIVELSHNKPEIAFDVFQDRIKASDNVIQFSKESISIEPGVTSKSLTKRLLKF